MSAGEPEHVLADRTKWPTLVTQTEQLGCRIISGPNAHGSFKAITPGGKSFLIYTGHLQDGRCMTFGFDLELTFDELAARIRSRPASSQPAKPQPTTPVETFRTAQKGALFA